MRAIKSGNVALLLVVGICIGAVAASSLIFTLAAYQYDSHSMMQQILSHAVPALPSVPPPGQKRNEEPSSAVGSNGAGWKDIHVFFGNDKHLHVPANAKSQCGQDDVVLTLLKGKRNGYFVDLAANNAVRLSNTLKLERQNNWNGICIEPNPGYWRGLSYRKCTVVAAVVGKKRMEEVSFIMHAGSAREPSGGILNEEFDNKPSSPKSKDRPTSLYTVPLLEVLRRSNAPAVMDYLSLDVEGAEYFVMRDFPFDLYKFRVMTVERPAQELVDLLYKEGYVYLAGFSEYGEETLFVHSSELKYLNVDGIKNHTEWRSTSTKFMTVLGSTLTKEDKPTVVARTKMG